MTAEISAGLSPGRDCLGGISALSSAPAGRLSVFLRVLSGDLCYVAVRESVEFRAADSRPFHHVSVLNCQAVEGSPREQPRRQSNTRPEPFSECFALLA